MNWHLTSVRPAIDVLRRSSSPGIPFKAISIGMPTKSLHFLGAGAGVLRDHLDQGRSRVGIRLDVEVVRGIQARDHEHQGAQKHDQAVVQAPGNDRADHDRLPRGEEECNQPNHLYESNAVIGLHFLDYARHALSANACHHDSVCQHNPRDQSGQGDASRVRASLAIEECPGTRIGLQGPRGGSLYN